MRPADCAELVECISPQTRRYMPVLFRISTTWLRLPLHSGVLTQAPRGRFARLQEWRKKQELL